MRPSAQRRNAGAGGGSQSCQILGYWRGGAPLLTALDDYLQSQEATRDQQPNQGKRDQKNRSCARASSVVRDRTLVGTLLVVADGVLLNHLYLGDLELLPYTGDSFTQHAHLDLVTAAA